MSNKEEFVCERGKSICYRIGSIFRKYYKYSDKKIVTSESQIASEILKNNINTPKPIGFGYSETRQMFYNDFKFHQIRKINTSELNDNILKNTIGLLNQFPTKIDCCDSWNIKYLPELYQQIDSTNLEQKKEAKIILNYLNNYPVRYFIHGDYSFENIGIDENNNQIIIFDFFDSCIGIEGWDLAYLFGSIPYKKVLIGEINDHILKMIKLIVTLKYIRGLRKNLEVLERKKNYEYWWKQN